MVLTFRSSTQQYYHMLLHDTEITEAVISFNS